MRNNVTCMAVTLCLKRSRFLERLPLGSVKQQRLVAKKVRQVKQLNLL